MADEIKNFLDLFVDTSDPKDGIIDVEPTPEQREAFVAACISGAEPVYSRYTTKKFVEMLSKIKKEAVYPGVQIGGTGPYYKITEAGVTSLFNTLETSPALEPKRNADGTLNVTPDKDGNVVVMGGNFEVTESVETPVNNTFVIGEETYTYSGVVENNKITSNTVTDSKGTKILNASASKVFTLNGISTTQYTLVTTVSNSVATVTGITIKKYDNITAAEGKNIVLNDATIKDGSIVTLKANNGNVSCNNLVFDAANGGLRNDRIGHACFVINADKSPKSVTVRDCVFNRGASETKGNNIYNAIEFNLGPNCKSVLIENCVFLGKLAHNAFNFYYIGDNTTIVVRNCYVDSPENVMRISNENNASNINILFENCVFDHWDEVGENAEQGYSGFCLCQDHLSASAAAADTKNEFAPSKVKITLKNCSGPTAVYGQENRAIPGFSNASTVCGVKSGTQLCYVYRDRGGILTYNEDLYPELTVIPGEAVLPAEVLAMIQ